MDDLARLGLYDLQADGAAHSLVRRVEDACRELSLVAFAKEARHVRLHHDGFGGHGLGIDHSVVHRLIVSQPDELPRRDTLGKGERDIHVPVFIRREGGVEERRLSEVLTKLDLRLDGGRSGLVGCFLSIHHSADNYFFIQFQHSLV